MSSGASAWVLSNSQTEPHDRMVFLALTETSGSGDCHSGVCSGYSKVAEFARTDITITKQAIAAVVELGELEITEHDDGLISWVIPELSPVRTPRQAIKAAAELAKKLAHMKGEPQLSNINAWANLMALPSISEHLSAWLTAEAGKNEPEPHAVGFSQDLLMQHDFLKTPGVNDEQETIRSAPEPRPPRPGEVVYLIGSPDNRLVKIGRSVNVEARLRSIQNMSPSPLKVLWTTPGGRELEAEFHAIFADYRVHGEWFDFGDRDAVTLVAAQVTR